MSVNMIRGINMILTGDTIKKRYLNPTAENIRQSFINDSAGRNAEIREFIKILSSIDEGVSIALDSEWGSGKTFFVSQVKMIFDYNNLSDIEKNGIYESEVLHVWENLTRQDDEFVFAPHLAVYFDAWANENDTDPLCSVILKILESADNRKSLQNRIDMKAFRSAFGKLTSSLNDFYHSDISENYMRDSFTDDLNEQKLLPQKTDECLRAINPDSSLRIVIFIDELDRCRPEYALRLLERIKHYFDTDRVTFVFSVNLSELQNMVKHCYGESYDSVRYLDKFFDCRMQPDWTKTENKEGKYAK